MTNKSKISKEYYCLKSTVDKNVAVFIVEKPHESLNFERANFKGTFKHGILNKKINSVEYDFQIIFRLKQETLA